MLNAEFKTNMFPQYSLMQMWSAFNVSRSLRLVSKKKWIMTYFLLNFLPKFIYMYRMDSVRSLIQLVSEMLKIPRDKVEAHFLKLTYFCNQQMFRTRCLWEISKYNRKPFIIHSSTRIVICTKFLIISYILQSYPRKWAILFIEIHCLI